MPEKITGDLEIVDGRFLVNTSNEDITNAVIARFGPPKGGVTLIANPGIIAMDGPSGTAIRLTARPVFVPPGTIPGAKLEVGGGGCFGSVEIKNTEDAVGTLLRSGLISIGDVIRLDGREGEIKLKGDLEILDDSGGVVIHLDRKARDIKLKGADCAEIFAAHDASALEPGSLCVIGPSGALEPCSNAYDTRVAGVVAGAGDLHPGIVLGQGTVAEQSVTLSITGRYGARLTQASGPSFPEIS
jgi:hypothetical protein